MAETFLLIIKTRMNPIDKIPRIASIKVNLVFLNVRTTFIQNKNVHMAFSRSCDSPDKKNIHP